MMVFFKQPFHYIIFILFYMIIIISVAVALAAMFSLRDSKTRKIEKLPWRFQRHPFPSGAIHSSDQQTRWLVTGGET